MILYAKMSDGEAAGLARCHNREQHNIFKTSFPDSVKKLKKHLDVENLMPKNQRRTANQIANEVFGVRVSMIISTMFF